MLDSAAWRRFGATAAGSRIFDSDLFERADVARRRLVLSYESLLHRGMFDEVRTFVVLIGHVKSGGSMLGAMLDAHDRAVFSDEVDVVRLVEFGFTRSQILHMCRRGAQREALKGRVTARRLEPYSLEIAGQSQGMSNSPILVGDSRAGPTTRRLGDNPASLERLEKTFSDVDLAFIHVVRDPRDPIAAMHLRSGRSIADGIDDYFDQCERVERLRSDLGDRVHTVHYEDLVNRPRETIGEVCAFTGLETRDDHLAACSALVDAERRPESSTISWDPGQLREIEDRSRAFGFLTRYVATGSGP
jgi:hypothetical protein